MTLDEMFDFEARRSPGLGHSVVTEAGIARKRAQMARLPSNPVRLKKRLTPAKPTAA